MSDAKNIEQLLKEHAEKEAQNYAAGLPYCDWHQTMETYTKSKESAHKLLLSLIDVMELYGNLEAMAAAGAKVIIGTRNKPATEALENLRKKLGVC